MPLPNFNDFDKSVSEMLSEVKIPDANTTKAKLENADLSEETALSLLSHIAHGGESDAIRLRAVEMSLKMHGSLQEKQVSEKPTFMVIINDPKAVVTVGGVNPILIPRTGALELESPK